MRHHDHRSPHHFPRSYRTELALVGGWQLKCRGCGLTEEQLGHLNHSSPFNRINSIGVVASKGRQLLCGYCARKAHDSNYGNYCSLPITSVRGPSARSSSIPRYDLESVYDRFEADGMMDNPLS